MFFAVKICHSAYEYSLLTVLAVMISHFEGFPAQDQYEQSYYFVAPKDTTMELPSVKSVLEEA